VNVTNVVNATVADGQGQGTIVNDDSVNLTISNPVVTEGNSGTTVLTYTVSLSGPAPAGGVTFDIATADGSATAGSDYVARALTGQTIPEGSTTYTFDVTVNGDTAFEPNETVLVNITNVVGAAVDTPQATGTITNDDPLPLPKIHEIQGSAYFSPILAADNITSFNTASTTVVTVQAVITAIDNSGNRKGFYITEETADWDASLGTSEGIFVMFSNDSGTSTLASGATTPALTSFAVGDLVTVTARVMEYQQFQNQPFTVLTQASSITRDATGLTLPVLTLGANHPIPNAILTAVTPDYRDSVDGPGDTFDFTNYALSYFETIESMLVTIPGLVAADGFVSTSGGRPFLQAYSTVHANPEQINSRGGYTIAGDPPLSLPDTPTTGDDTRNGGRVLHDGDINPDIIEIDFTDFAMAPPAGLASVTMGDPIGNATGIIGFDFTDRKLYVTQLEGFDVNAVNATTPVREEAVANAEPRALTVATFNVENLDPTDGQARFEAIAQSMVTNLKLPDILTIEEIQDNNGAAAGDGISATGSDASVTWTMLVNALNAAAAAAGSNAVYQWVDQPPVYNAEGGQQSGNIRVGFLYNTTRVQLGDLAADAPIEQRRQFTDRLGDNVRDAGDRILFSDDMIGGVNTADYTTTRKSLLGQFTFNGNNVFVLANHLPAKGGSGQFYQLNQNLESGQPSNSDWAQRNAIGEDIFNLANFIQTNAPGAGFIAAGDFNDFQFYRPLEAATGYVFADGTARNDGARLLNLTLTLPEAERYTYTFDGRSQALDHILVNSLLAPVATYDVVHINTGYGRNSTTPLSDHDPAVATLDFRSLGETLNGTSGNDFFRVEQGGNDTVSGLAGRDIFFFGGAFTADDQVNGGSGIDTLALQGDYSAGVTLGTGTTSNINSVEWISLLSGSNTFFGESGSNRYSYNITVLDANFENVEGGFVRVNGANLLPGENLTFNGSNESSTRFVIYGGQGTDILTGNGQSDIFFFGHDNSFNAGDKVVGGDGYDGLFLRGDYAIDFNDAGYAGAFSGIENITLSSFSDDAPPARRRRRVRLCHHLGRRSARERGDDDVNGSLLTAEETMVFDGASESGGNFRCSGRGQ
jgi:predicted extracellular nuclease